MTTPSPTPYDGSSKLFTIGLAQLDPADWLALDETYAAQLAEKRRLYAEIPDKVFVEEPETRPAQQEVLDLVRAHLAQWRPDLPTDGDPALPPLRQASLLAQEDLILMRRGENGWRLAAGALCFPSSWTLAEKFGRPLSEIHAPVPGFAAGTRNDALIARMFDNFQPERPVQRYNWSLQANDTLYHPLSDAGRIERAEAKPPRFVGLDVLAAAFIRVERQTLRKLPLSGDILFTIRIYLDPLGWIRSHPRGAAIAASLAGQLRELTGDQLDYKGFAADRDRLVAALDAVSENR